MYVHGPTTTAHRPPPTTARYMNEAELVAPCLQTCLREEHEVASRRSSLYLASCRRACTTPAALEAARLESQRSRALLAPVLSIGSLFDAADRLTSNMAPSERHKLTDSAGPGSDVAPSGTYEGDIKLFGIQVNVVALASSLNLDLDLDLDLDRTIYITLALCFTLALTLKLTVTPGTTTAILASALNQRLMRSCGSTKPIRRSSTSRSLALWRLSVTTRPTLSRLARSASPV